MRRRVALSALGLAALAACGPAGAQETGAPARPRLVVVLSIDQFRPDYLSRFEDLYLPPLPGGKPGGFRWLLTRGAVFADAHHDHYPTYTGPGHAVLLTGAPPQVSGIVGNQWYDRALRRIRYCAEGAPKEGQREGGISPETLLVTTVGDELETSTGGNAKTFSFGLKDRASVLMAGHLADGAYWFDESRGRWQTSESYRGDDRMPEWLREWNQRRIPDESFGSTWTFDCDPAALARVWVAPGEPRPEPFTFALDQGKPLSKGGEGNEAKLWYRTWARTPFANNWVLRSALRCVEAEGLGRDRWPDLLTVNLSTNDYVGHGFGPDSAQVLDLAVKTDRALSAFLQGLDANVGLEHVAFVLTADHGVAPNPLRARKSGLPAGVQPDDDGGVGVSPQRAAAEKALDAAFGDDDWVLSHVEHQLYLNPDAFGRHPTASRSAAEEIAARACESFPGIHACFTRSQILEGRMPETLAARAVTLGFHRRVSGDVVIVADPFWSPVRSREGATHGSVFPYDSRVPLVFAGSGAESRVVRERASTMDIAPTLSFLLGIAPPSGSQGRILPTAAGR